jgi:hypothetical protein
LNHPHRPVEKGQCRKAVDILVKGAGMSYSQGIPS